MTKVRWNEAKRDQFLEHVRLGMQIGAASDALRLDRMAVRAYIASHPDFEARVLDAKVDATEKVLESLWNGAVSGNVHAAKAWLDLVTGPPRVIAPETSPARAEDDFLAGLDNVAPLDPRRRKRA